MPHVAVVGMPAWDTTMPFHALAVIAGVGRESGVPVSVHDLNIDFYHHVSEQEKTHWTDEANRCWPSETFCRDAWDRHESWLQGQIDELVRRERPTLIAFSVNMTTRYFSQYAGQYIKANWPGIPVMFGGVDCFPAEQFTNFLKPAGAPCDIICHGEAEIAFPQYLSKFVATNDWRTQVPGFAFYDGRQLVNTGSIELPTLQERLPIPAFDLFDLSKYAHLGKLPFYFSRGCVYKCHFCSERPNFEPFRCRKAEDSFAELMAILPLAQRYTDTPCLSLADSNFNANIKELRKFVDLLLQNDVKIQWGGQAHFTRSMTAEFLEKLARSGFQSVFWGFESGSQHVIDLMNKRYQQTEARRILEDCNRIGISQHLPILLGFPGETPEDLVDTLEFILQYKDEPHSILHPPHMVLVRPNSPLHDDYAEFGLANNHYYEWCRVDGTNTLEIRIARRFIARQARYNSEFSMDQLVDQEEIQNVDLNKENIARDVFRALYATCSRANVLPRFFAIVGDWSRESLKTDADFRAGINDKEDCLARWLKLDKNSSQGRERMYALVLFSLAALKEAIGEDRSTTGVAA